MYSPFQCYIIDDEPDSRLLVKKFIARVPFLSLMGESGNALDALFEVQELKPDIIFLDVQMSDLGGFEFIRILKMVSPKIIMISAYPQFAVDGFEHNVVDYLVKPVSFERFMKAINKIDNSKLQTNAENPLRQPDLNSLSKDDFQQEVAADILPKQQNDFILVKHNKKLIRITVEEIQLIESLKDYMKIHLADKVLITHGTLLKMIQLLPEEKFIRISRSFIIRENAIREIDGNQITTIYGRKVDIGITYREAVLKKLKQAKRL